MSDGSLVVFVAASEEGTRTGNETTLQRLARRLREAGVDVLVARPGQSADDVLRSIRAGARRPALVHAFHARRSGPRGVELAARLGVPLLVGLTGTDLARDVHDPVRAEVVLDVLRRADAVTCGNSAEVRVLSALVDPAPRAFVLPKGIEPPDRPPTVEQGRSDVPLVLQVAHPRRVKNTALAVRAVRRLAGRRPARLVVLGDVLEPQYTEELIEAAGGPAAWAVVHHPAVPRGDVPDHIAAADVVLNTSDGEGGSNAILEAMALGRAVLASAVPGNVAYVGDDGSRGRLYPVRIEPDGRVVHDEDALVDALDELLSDDALRARLGEAARAWVRREHSPDAERRALRAAYTAVLSASPPSC